MNNSILRVKRDGVEYFTLVSTGECGMSQRGLARGCGVSHTAIQKLELALATKSPTKRLNRFVGKALTLATSFSSSDQKTRNVTIYKADFCSAIIVYFATQGLETAADLVDAFLEIGLTSYIQGVTGWLPAEYQASQTARISIDLLISKVADKTRPIHFDKEWQTQACRVTGYQWQGYPMANFIRRSIYEYFGKPCVERLNEVNPLIDGRHRENYHYEHFTPEVDEALLQRHIAEVGTLLKASFSEFQFWQLMRNRFGDAIQIELDLD